MGAFVEVSLAELGARLARGETTSEALTQHCLQRIADIDPRLRAVLSLNPRALDDSRAADQRRGRNRVLGALDGLPVLIKDNIDVAGLATTAGSLALIDNIAAQDAPAVQSLRQAGMIVIGKTNLSEWANIRSSNSTSGWSAVGGQTRNPYDLTHSACGSSSGSAVAVAASLVPAAIGTETDGSIVWPSAACGVVGLKPTKGLVSQKGVIPISLEQDAPGPMARDVTDLGLVLGALCAKNFELDARALKGARLGALRNLPEYTDEARATFESALEVLRGQGATIVDIDINRFDVTPFAEHYFPAMLTEFKVAINATLATANARVKTRTLADLIAFNKTEPRELEWFGQEHFEAAQKTEGMDAPNYRAWRALLSKTAREQGLDRMLQENNVTALVAPTNDPAPLLALGQGEFWGGSISTLPAAAGYPHLTVPSGYVRGLPLGLSFIGPAGSEQALLSLGFAFEQAHKIRRAPRLD